jgi:hypothetical protein
MSEYGGALNLGAAVDEMNSGGLCLPRAAAACIASTLIAAAQIRAGRKVKFRQDKTTTLCSASKSLLVTGNEIFVIAYLLKQKT